MDERIVRHQRKPPLGRRLPGSGRRGGPGQSTLVRRGPAVPSGSSLFRRPSAPATRRDAFGVVIAGAPLKYPDTVAPGTDKTGAAGSGVRAKSPRSVNQPTTAEQGAMASLDSGRAGTDDPSREPV
ncbi:predicted protein [Streptomyces sp. AA4]|nr:predicted protein [Streptomyces sp. AA4]